MEKLYNALKYLFTDTSHFFDSLVVNTGKYLPDKLFLKLRYRCKMGQWPNLTVPKTFTEKLQWLKLYNRKPEYTTMVDKYAVKDYVASKIGEEYIIPTLGVWDTPDDIDWDSLPDQFVLKTTHGGGGCGVVICKDKSSFDRESAKRKLNRSLKSDIYLHYREWPYKNVRKRIIAEKYITSTQADSFDELPDYKFYCFDGEPKIVMVASGRFKENTYFDYFDMNWVKLPLVWDKPNSNFDIQAPKCLDEMIYICRSLTQGIPHVRCDLYLVNGNVYFGELTFFDASGFCKFNDEKWNLLIGDYIDLPIECS